MSCNQLYPCCQPEAASPMSTCEHGPGNGPGCAQDIVWLNGKWYSPHFALSHWSRLKKGKPKVDSVTKRSNGALMEALTVNFGKEKAKAMAPTLKGDTVEDKLRDAFKREWDG